MHMGLRRQYWSWGSLFVLLLIAPLLLFPSGWRLLALLVLPIVWIGNRVLTGHFVPRTPYDGIMLCLLLMVLVSLYATYDMAASLPKITGVLLGISVFYGIVNVVDTPKHFNWILVVTLLIVAAFSGLVLVGTNWGRKILLLEQIGALLPALVRGLPGADAGFHPAEVGGALTWIIFLPMTAFIGLWAQRRSLSVVAVLIGLGILNGLLIMALVLTQSRSAWLGFAAGTVLILWLLGRGGRIILVGVVAVRLISAVLLGPDRLWPGNSSQSLGGELGAVFTPGLSDRVEIWARAVYGLQDFSFTGMGLGTFRYVMPVLYPLFTVSPDVDLGHAHNEWLQAGVDLGLIGLIAFVALQGLSLVLAYQAFHLPLPTLAHWLMAGVLAGLIAHSVFGLTDAVALGAKPGIFFWLLVALTAGVWRLKAFSTFPALPQHRSTGGIPS
jgi:putative inorganic carbon (HCO3(-)) transporter